MLKSQMLLINLLIFFSSATFYAQIDPWKITVSRIDTAKYHGATVANGMIGIVSSPKPFKVENVLLAGAYDQYGRGRVSNFLNGFNILDMNVDIDGQRISGATVNNFKQELDMQRASLKTTFDYEDKATVTYTYYSLRHLPFTVFMDVSIVAKKAITFTSASIMESPDGMTDTQKYFTEIIPPHAKIPLLTSTAKSPTGKLLFAASTNFMFFELNGKQPTVSHDEGRNNMHLMEFSKDIKKGETYNYAVIGSTITSAHNPDPLNEAERMTIFANLEGRERLLALHKKEWKKLWESDITIEGDPQSQQDIHSMLYHLYSFAREGSGFSLSPMGLSGLGYNGHIFWDAEVWMFPVFLVLHPEIARSLIDYRYERLEMAKKNAVARGYKGAMYPWESADAGGEETPVWALSGPFEHHITACVANAAWNYYSVTQDKEWLIEKGWPILSATADFWASRVDRNGSGHYDIKNVVAADEWAENVDNDAFTNASAKINLENAATAAKVIGLEPDPDWLLVAQNIPILKMDDGVTREHATYKGGEIKQADVNLLAYPLKVITEPEQIRRDLKYYQTRVPYEGTPAMTQSIFSLLYARLGDSEKAFHWFKDSYEPNILPPFRVIAENKGGTNPYFATGAGGILQSVLMGFCGLDITENGIVQVNSKLPKNWRSVKVTGVGSDKKIFIRY